MQRAAALLDTVRVAADRNRVDRVLVPSGSAIVGFGPGGVVYLGMPDAAGIHVQRVRLK